MESLLDEIVFVSDPRIPNCPICYIDERLGMDSKHVVGKSISDVFYVSDPMAKHHVDDVVRKKEERVIDFDFSKDGIVYKSCLKIVPKLNVDGELCFLLGKFHMLRPTACADEP